MLRHAALYGSAYGWESRIAAASRVDSIAGSPSTKFLVASLIAQMADPQVGEIGAQVAGTSFGPRALGGAANAASSDRATGCRRIAPLLASLSVAEARMKEGGARYSGGGAAQVSAAVAGERQRLSDLQDVCARP
jgi:hypothetical protein